jgi:hypothetical protein
MEEAIPANGVTTYHMAEGAKCTETKPPSQAPLSMAKRTVRAFSSFWTDVRMRAPYKKTECKGREPIHGRMANGISASGI